MSEILSKAEQTMLSDLVADVESRTAGEIVTVVRRRSSEYAAVRIAWAAALALLAACAAHLIWPGLPVLDLLGAQALLALVFAAALGWPPLLRVILPRWLKQQTVDELAQRMFLQLGVTETRDRSGVLILLSEFERRVVILGDRGIHDHLGTATWQQLVAELVQSIRAGDAAAGLRSIIERLGNELARKFPQLPGDTNELPNAVIVDTR